MTYQLITKPTKGIWFVLYTLRPFSSYPNDYRENDVLRNVEGKEKFFNTGLAAWKFSLKLNDGFHEHPALRIRKVTKVKFPRIRGKHISFLD